MNIGAWLFIIILWAVVLFLIWSFCTVRNDYKKIKEKTEHCLSLKGSDPSRWHSCNQKDRIIGTHPSIGAPYGMDAGRYSGKHPDGQTLDPYIYSEGLLRNDLIRNFQNGEWISEPNDTNVPDTNNTEVPSVDSNPSCSYNDAPSDSGSDYCSSDSSDSTDYSGGSNDN